MKITGDKKQYGSNDVDLCNVTVSGTPEELRAIGNFILECADDEELPPTVGRHFHHQYSKWEKDMVDLTVYRDS